MQQGRFVLRIQAYMNPRSHPFPMSPAFLPASSLAILAIMSHDQPDSADRTRSSLIRGLIQGDSDQWELFCETYGDLLTRYAASRLRGQHRDDVEEVVQNVFRSLLAQRQRDRFSYQPDKGRFRDYLRTCVKHEVLARLQQRPAGPSIDDERGIEPVDEETDESAFIARYFLTILGKVIGEVRARCVIGNEAKWRSFVERVLHRRPAAEVADELGIEPALVYKNVSRVLEEIFQICRGRYLADFGEDGLSRILGEIGPKVMEDLSGHVLALESAGPRAAERSAIDYFLAVLRDRLPTFRAEVIAASPATWAAFRQYTRAVYEEGDPARPDPAVSRLLDRVDRLLREHGEADLGDRDHYRTLKGLGRDAVAMLCGSPAVEAIWHDQD
jgi:RNA polymerase sigma factor (sigma-70 family)